MAQKRTNQVRFRVTLEEQLKLKKLASMSGRSVEAFVRDRTLDNKKILIQDAETMRGIYRELSALGNNVNQIARVANSTGLVNDVEISALLFLVKELQKSTELKLRGVFKTYGDIESG